MQIYSHHPLGQVEAATSSNPAGDDLLYAVLVESSTHDDLNEGLVTTEIVWTTVLASDVEEAMLVASQMAACRGRMPTRVTPEF